MLQIAAGPAREFKQALPVPILKKLRLSGVRQSLQLRVRQTVEDVSAVVRRGTAG